MNVNNSVWRCRSELAAEFSSLIARYPLLGEREIDHLVEIYARLRVVDLALMMADHDLAPMLDDFCRDNRERLRRSPSLRAIATTLFGAAIVILAALQF